MFLQEGTLELLFGTEWASLGAVWAQERFLQGRWGSSLGEGLVENTPLTGTWLREAAWRLESLAYLDMDKCFSGVVSDPSTG